MKKLCIATVLSAGLLLMGCASIVGSRSENVKVLSNVEGTELVIKNSGGMPVYQGNAPTMINLDKRKGYFQGEKYSITATKKGYNSQTLTLDTDISLWYLGNIIFGGLIGILIVDPATGAMWTFDEDTVFLNMEKN